MSLSATTEFINICMKADKALREVDDAYSMYQEIVDKRELRKDAKAMEFLSIYKYDIYNEVSNSLYGGKKKSYTKRRNPKRRNKTRSKR